MGTVQKAISLLDLFTLAEPEIGLSDLARKSGLDKATTRRLLVSLTTHRLIEQDAATRRYRLGAGLSRLARIREAQFPLARIAQPVVRELSETTGETVHLSEFSDGALLIMHVEVSTKANRVNVEIGQILPLHATASGIAFLAAADKGLTDALLASPLDAFTGHTLTAPSDIRRLITFASEHGYSRSAQGYDEGVHSVAAAIFGADGKPLATLSVASPIARVDEQTAVQQGEAVKRAARDVSARLSGETPAQG